MADEVLDQLVNACEKTAYQKTKVCLPVKVTPFGQAGETKTKCCGDPVISKDACTGTKNGVCEFSIVQELCIEIPVMFGAKKNFIFSYEFFFVFNKTNYLAFVGFG